MAPLRLHFFPLLAILLTALLHWKQNRVILGQVSRLSASPAGGDGDVWVASQVHEALRHRHAHGALDQDVLSRASVRTSVLKAAGVRNKFAGKSVLEVIETRCGFEHVRKHVKKATCFWSHTQLEDGLFATIKGIFRGEGSQRIRDQNGVA